MYPPHPTTTHTKPQLFLFLYSPSPFSQLGAALRSPVGEESACNAGGLGLIPGLGRSPGEGKGYTHFSILAGESHGLYSLWGHKESGTTEGLAPSPSFVCLFRYSFSHLHLCLRLESGTSLPPLPTLQASFSVATFNHML